MGLGGRCLDLMEIFYNVIVTGFRREVVEESLLGIKNNEVYFLLYKRLVRIIGLNIFML